ncbi:hypothetical protein Droror1_Dr00023583 [Drosera rotundifolia]
MRVLLAEIVRREGGERGHLVRRWLGSWWCLAAGVVERSGGGLCWLRREVVVLLGNSNGGCCGFVLRICGVGVSWFPVWDELLWVVAWLRKATYEDIYLSYIESKTQTLGAIENNNEFGWDNKYAGLHVLEVLQGGMYTLESYKASADSFLCTLVSYRKYPLVSADQRVYWNDNHIKELMSTNKYENLKAQ